MVEIGPITGISPAHLSQRATGMKAESGHATRFPVAIWLGPFNSHSSTIPPKKAFVLGAGLGTRLRPLTDVLPKPLIPVINRPLITWAFDALLQGGAKEFIVNTHHLPEAWPQAFPHANWRGHRITFVHEHPVVLETEGGIANIAPLVRDASFWVFNGDILTDLPLAGAERIHRENHHLATLILRSTGPNPNVTFDPGTGKVRDLRQALGTQPDRLYQFTGIYAIHPDFSSISCRSRNRSSQPFCGRSRSRTGWVAWSLMKVTGGTSEIRTPT